MTDLRRLPLSVLDLATVPEGTRPAEALTGSLALVRQAEALGYTRYWVAEHHNMPGIASSAPAVLIAHLAMVTERIRLGSGGVMLPNHAPLVVAEQFGTLEALHPGRIDLGLGRAPGTDPATAAALRRTTGPGGAGADDFPQQLLDLISFFTGDFPATHPYRSITATPGRGYLPSLWLLGSSGYSAQVAGLLGLPFAFAHHFSAENTLPALQLYRNTFRPSAVLDAPYASVGVSVIAAPTDAEAHWHASAGALAYIRLRSGRPGLFPTPEEAAAYPYTPAERAMVDARLANQVIGSPQTVRRGLDDLATATQADELMVTTMTHDPSVRLRSYQLVAELADLGTARVDAV